MCKCAGDCWGVVRSGVVLGGRFCACVNVCECVRSAWGWGGLPVASGPPSSTRRQTMMGVIGPRGVAWASSASAWGAKNAKTHANPQPRVSFLHVHTQIDEVINSIQQQLRQLLATSEHERHDYDSTFTMLSTYCSSIPPPFIQANAPFFRSAQSQY